MIFWITAALPWLRDRAEEFADFLRSVPNLLAPKPTSVAPPFVPPFTGGQCAINYRVNFDRIRISIGDSVENNTYTLLGSIGGAYDDGINIGILFNGGASKSVIAESGNGQRIRVNSVVPVSGADTCGNLNNPNPPTPIADDGLFNPTNPRIGDDNGNLNPSAIVLAPFIPPLAILPFVVGAYNAAIDAARAATDVFNKINKIIDILDTLDNLLDKLDKDSDDKKKDDPENRDIVRQTYGQILGDGALDFFPENNTRFQAIQLDVVITNIPSGFGKFFGNLSPHRYRYKELGYIAFYSVTQGILSVHSVQFKRTSYQIPELAVGFIYHLGLNDQIRGYAFGTFSMEKP